MPIVHCRIKGYIKPFERELALREIRALAHGRVHPIDGTERTASIFSVQVNGCADELRNGLAYWSSVGLADNDLTVQVRGEATSTTTRELLREPRGEATKYSGPKLPRRRCLRYASHGMHEYRGKFFPQLVRALINIGQVPANGIVLDPMCGSGTTLVEARLAGRTAYGLDMNPLSVFVAQTKCQALTIAPSSLTKAHEQLLLDLRSASPRHMHHLESLPQRDQDYLSRWFATSTLKELDNAYTAIEEIRNESIKNFFTVCLSNVLRSVSWQKVDDLRVRREILELDAGEVTQRFLSQARRSVETVAAFNTERGQTPAGDVMIMEGDARHAGETLQSIVGKVDTVITSPPYATALPYIDTDRLSLIYLGLLSRNDHATRDRLMIGNREVTTRARGEYWANYVAAKQLLPEQVRDVIDRIDRLNTAAPVGFRRKNLAALLSMYFFDMRKVLSNIRTLLRPGGTAFLVVGNNRTTAGDQLIHIRTADQLAEMANDLGLSVTESLSMEMLPSRDIFRKNAVPSEKIISLTKPKSN